MDQDTAVRRYTFKCYPTAEQADALQRHAHMVGDLWNALLERCETNYRLFREGRTVVDTKAWPESGAARAQRLWREKAISRSHLTGFDLSNEVTWLRQECPEWAALSVWTGLRVTAALDRAFAAFFRRAKAGAGPQAGYPRFRPRRLQTWVPHRFASGCKLTRLERDDVKHEADWLLALKGVDGPIRARGRLPAAAEKWTDADVRLDAAGVWWLSVAVALPTGRRPGRRATTVRFDLVDWFAELNGMPLAAAAVGLDLAPDEAVEALQRRMAEARAAQDWDAYRQWKRQKARREARRTRQRNEALHLWTTRLVAGASSLIITKPAEALPALVASGRGDAGDWGAAVETKALLNAAILRQAPGRAIAMLEYKAAEAGIPCVVQVAEAAKAAVGNDAVRTTKAARKARAAAKKALAA